MNEEFLLLLDIAISTDTPAIKLALENLLTLCKLERASGATIRECPLTATQRMVDILKTENHNLNLENNKIRRELTVYEDNKYISNKNNIPWM
jgi:hypothetical protein